MNNQIFIDIETMGLNAYEDRITCIGMEVWKNGKKVLDDVILENDEKVLLQKFLIINDDFEAETVTWNGERFDIPYIQIRCLKHGLNYCAQNPYDLKKEFPKFGLEGGWRAPSLNETAKFFGIETKSATGVEAPFMFKYGMLEELKSYCAKDVEILRKIYFEYHRRIFE